jgi:Zn-dependent protease with chaperone function
VTSAAPTILALETDSAWVVVLAVSVVTLPAALLLRRIIGRPGGAASGLLLGLPLLLPVVAGLAYEHAVLPEIAVLRPVGSALGDEPGGLMHLLFLRDGRSNVVTPYAFSGSAGPWLLVFGVAVSSFMLLRRFVGALLVHRLVVRSRPLRGEGREDAIRTQVAALAGAAGMKTSPEVRILPRGVAGAFAVGARRPRILVAEPLLEVLHEAELEAILAHEVAHLEARDVPLMFGAGVLRDMLAWNPLSHLALRRLLSDREFEADRRAAAMTGRPLDLASGLLKMCELMRGAKHADRSALAFLRSGGKVSRRVAHLIDLADDRLALRTADRLPYLAAALVVALLGLQAGARLAGQESAALAIVVGTPTETSRGLWVPKHHVAAEPEPTPHTVRARRRPGQLDLRRTARYPELLYGAVKEKDLPRWINAVSRIADRLNISATTLRWQARAVPIFSQPTVGPISILRMESQLRL